MHFTTRWNKSIWKDNILYDPNYMTFWKKHHYGASKKISRCLGFGREIIVRGCLGSKTITYGRVRADSCHCTFVKPTECVTPRMNPNGNYGLWGILVGQCRLIGCNKCTKLVSILVKEAVVCGNCLYFQLNFTVRCSKNSLLIKILKVMGKGGGRGRSNSRPSHHWKRKYQRMSLILC